MGWLKRQALESKLVRKGEEDRRLGGGQKQNGQRQEDMVAYSGHPNLGGRAAPCGHEAVLCEHLW